MQRSKKRSGRNKRQRRRQRTPRLKHRRVRPGTTYLITKKCIDDLFLIRPCPLVNQILLYLLILKANRYGLLIHGFCFLSNHFHLVVTDVRGKLPAFMREFLSESSKAVQPAIGIDRRIWSRKEHVPTELLDCDAAQRKIAYALLNPPRAGLTTPEEWPGLTTIGLRFGDVLEASRPDVYFSRRRPESVSTTLASLEIPFGEPAEETERRTKELVEAEMKEIVEDLEKHGKALLGRESVLSCSRNRRGTRRVRNLRPRFASTNRGLVQSAIRAARQFEIDHDRAKQEYMAGKRKVVFPEGTYGYRVVLQVRVARGKERAA